MPNVSLSLTEDLCIVVSNKKEHVKVEFKNGSHASISLRKVSEQKDKPMLGNGSWSKNRGLSIATQVGLDTDPSSTGPSDNCSSCIYAGNPCDNH